MDEHDEDDFQLSVVEADEPDLYALGFDEALDQASALVRQRYHAVRGGGELRAADVETLLEEIADLGRE